MRASGKWALVDVPHKGWSCIDVEDLGEPSATCEMCETQTIRYVHRMQHPEYRHGVLACGCICAGFMEEDREAPREREAELRSRASKRSRWLRRAWRVSQRGNDYLKLDGTVVVVFREPRGWKYIVKDARAALLTSTSKLYDTGDAAKLAAFDALHTGGWQ